MNKYIATIVSVLSSFVGAPTVTAGLYGMYLLYYWVGEAGLHLSNGATSHTTDDAGAFAMITMFIFILVLLFAAMCLLEDENDSDE